VLLRDHDSQNHDSEKHDSENRDPATSALCQQPNPLARAVEEAAMPGQPDAYAFPISPGNSPSRIAGLPLARRDHRSACLRRSHVFGEPNVPQIVAGGNEKPFRACAEAVEDETSLWNVEEKCVQRKCGEIGEAVFNNLDPVKELRRGNRKS